MIDAGQEKESPMKYLLLLAAFFSASAFADYCSIRMVDNYGYTVRTYQGYDYSYNCRDFLRDCNRDLRTNNQGRGVRCVRDTNGYPGPNPNPYPNPYPPSSNRFGHLLNMSETAVANQALRGLVGTCRVQTGGYYSSCNYYVKVNNMSYPETYGSGCAHSQYTYRFGCNFSNELQNAGCLIKKAIRENRCR